MVETVLLVVLIVVLFLTTVCSVFAMVRLRRKMNSQGEESLDAGFDICINELNKMGSLIKSDLDEKYKEILFLYNLIEDRHKQIESLVSKGRTRVSFEDAVDEIEANVVMPAYEELYDFEDFVERKSSKPYSEPVKPMQNESEGDYMRSSIPDHKVILQMSEQGLSIADIAKDLGIGQGEVKLILNIARK